jgi:predicted nucleic acid-binding protein
VKIFFDTSTIVAALVVQHPSHLACLPRLLRVQGGQDSGLVSTHSLAELYAVLTRLPYRPKINPDDAQRLMVENLKVFDKIQLDERDYERAIAQMVKCNLPGGGIFDALIAQAALKGNADVLLTLNPKHFIRLSEDIASRVEVPS